MVKNDLIQNRNGRTNHSMLAWGDTLLFTVNFFYSDCYRSDRVSMRNHLIATDTNGKATTATKYFFIIFFFVKAAFPIFVCFYAHCYLMFYFGVFWILVQTKMAICFIAAISKKSPFISLITNVLWILQK